VDSDQDSELSNSTFRAQRHAKNAILLRHRETSRFQYAWKIRSLIGHLEPALGTRSSEALYIPGEAQLDDRAFLRVVAIAVEGAGSSVTGRLSLKKIRSPMPED
jgi:glycine/D-amino acid oxidase-like deaminating enzyme